MGILKTMWDSWCAKTTAEKVKTILGLAADIGAGAIGSDIASRASADKGPLTKICTAVAGAGLGIAASRVATEALNDTVDAFTSIRNPKKEEHADA